MNILEAFRRIRIRRKYSKLMKSLSAPTSPAFMQALLDAVEHPTEIPRVELRHFQYVLVHLREADPDEVPKLFAKVVETFLSHDAMLDARPPLLIGYFGVPNPKYDSTEARTNLVAALLAENGSAVRVAHGQCNGLVGGFGGPRRWFYTAIVPNFSAVLKKLLDLEFGTAVEIS